MPNEMKALASRLHGLELLVGPYTVAHYRLLREITAAGVTVTERLPIYLADTLAPASGTFLVTPRLGFMSGPIVHERQGADRLKRETPIIAIVGNPPYRRLEAGEESQITSGWDNGFWDDLKAPVRDAGWGNELNTFPELSVAFWRWCLWKLFESDGAPGKGVLCLITNRTFLAGHPYAGLRQMLRQRFARIDIIDLRGDSRGARPAVIETDENVFQIQVGVCIVVAVAEEPAPGTEATVRYADVWRHGAFTARDKLALLGEARAHPERITFVEVDRSGLQDFVPTQFGGVHWPSLYNTFVFSSSGIQTKRDRFSYAFSNGILQQRLSDLRSAKDSERAELFHVTRDRTFPSSLDLHFQPDIVTQVVYRPLDTRLLLNRRAFIDFPRPNLQSAWGTSNVALYAMPSGTGSGPAVWVHGLLPDYHGFSGRGGYAFPLYDRRHGATAHNLNPALLAGLAHAYGRPVAAEETFDTIIALLSASSYTRRFAWDLEEAFAHIPFPADAALFAEAARIGAEIRALESFARDPAPAYRSTRLLGRASGVILAVPAGERAFQQDGTGAGFVALQEDQSLRLAGLPDRVWRFGVSGYRVLQRWLAARNGEALDAALQRAILDICWRIEELLHWFDAADAVLDGAVSAALRRDVLGLDAAGTPPPAPLESPDAAPDESPA